MTSTLPPPLPLDHPTEESIPAYNRHKEEDDETEPRGRASSDPAAVEASALGSRPTRWWQFWRFPKKAKIVLGMVVLALVALVASMIWYGVHRAQERKANPADLSAARNMVEPEIFTSLVEKDGDLLTPFEFSAPTISNRRFFAESSTPTSNATVLTSSSQLLQLPTAISSSSYFVKVFGNRSTDIIFASSPENSTDWTAQVSSFWKVSPGETQEERAQWGMDQLSRTVGGSYGFKLDSSQGDGAVGLALETVGNDTFRDGDLFTVAALPDLWLDSSMLFNVSSTAAGGTTFRDLRNYTFDSLDVRLATGSMLTEYDFPLSTRILNIFTGSGIIGFYSLGSGTLLSHGTIQPVFTFPPEDAPAASAPYNLTLISTNGYISANITSISLSSSPGINLDATSLSPSTTSGREIKVFFPLSSFNGTFELASNDGSATVVRADIGYNGAVGWLNWGGRRGIEVSNEVNVVKDKMNENGKGRVRLNAEKGDVGLSVGPGNFAKL
ncbi:hypothetical protein BDY24DRAFT_418234 [Mrakia frigida]|uniref:uncharacterized protein n=1 Tax=Mrakia frigida TaxID=29902 RepID=UPI003FCC2549